MALRVQPGMPGVQESGYSKKSPKRWVGPRVRHLMRHWQWREGVWALRWSTGHSLSLQPAFAVKSLSRGITLSLHSIRTVIACVNFKDTSWSKLWVPTSRDMMKLSQKKNKKKPKIKSCNIVQTHLVWRLWKMGERNILAPLRSSSMGQEGSSSLESTDKLYFQSHMINFF